MKNTIAPAISVLFNADSQGITLYLRGLCNPEHLISIIHDSDSLPVGHYCIGGDDMLVALLVRDGDALIITVQDHCHEIVACGFYEVRPSLISFGKILGPLTHGSLQASQENIEEVVDRALQAAMSRVFPEVA